jgi:hypothetical protein
MEEHTMGEQSTDSGASTQDGNKPTSGDTSAAGDKPKTITMTSEQLAERLARAKPADYDDLKAKAGRLDELEAANKSEIEKATEKATAAERERDAAKADAMRWKVAAKHGISDEDAELFLTGTDEATLTKQAERLTARVADRKKNGNHVPREGTPPSGPQPDEMREFTRKLFQNAD